MEKKKLYYDGKEIALGMPIEKFTEAMGMYNRIDIDSSGGFTNRTWYWKKKNSAFSISLLDQMLCTCSIDIWIYVFC